MTTKDHKIATENDNDAEMSRDSFNNEMQGMLSQANELLAASSSVASRLSDDNVKQSKYVDVLCTYGQTLSGEMGRLRNSIDHAEKTLMEIQKLPDEQYMLGMLEVSGSLCEAIEQFNELGVPAHSSMDDVLNKIQR